MQMANPLKVGLTLTLEYVNTLQYQFYQVPCQKKRPS